MNLRRTLRRRDVEFLAKVWPKLKAWGYTLPMTNAEIRTLLADKEERKEITTVIRKALAE